MNAYIHQPIVVHLHRRLFVVWLVCLLLSSLSHHRYLSYQILHVIAPIFRSAFSLLRNLCPAASCIVCSRYKFVRFPPLSRCLLHASFLLFPSYI